MLALVFPLAPVLLLAPVFLLALALLACCLGCLREVYVTVLDGGTPLLRWPAFARFVALGFGPFLGVGIGFGVGFGLSLDRARAEGAGPAGKSSPVHDARPGPKDKPPVRMLEQTLMLGGGAGGGGLGTSGQWGEVRAAVAAEFRPTAALISTEAKPLTVAKQLTREAQVLCMRHRRTLRFGAPIYDDPTPAP